MIVHQEQHFSWLFITNSTLDGLCIKKDMQSPKKYSGLFKLLKKKFPLGLDGRANI